MAFTMVIFFTLSGILGPPLQVCVHMNLQHDFGPVSAQYRGKIKSQTQLLEPYPVLPCTRHILPFITLSFNAVFLGISIMIFNQMNYMGKVYGRSMY